MALVLLFSVLPLWNFIAGLCTSHDVFSCSLTDQCQWLVVYEGVVPFLIRNPFDERTLVADVWIVASSSCHSCCELWGVTQKCSLNSLTVAGKSILSQGDCKADISHRNWCNHFCKVEIDISASLAKSFFDMAR